MPACTATVPLLFSAAPMAVVPGPFDLVSIPWLLKVAPALPRARLSPAHYLSASSVIFTIDG